MVYHAPFSSTMPITSDGRTKSRKLSYSCAWNEIRRSRWLDAFDMMPQFVQKPRNRGTCERDGILESKRIQCCGQIDSTTNIHRNKNNWWCLQDWIRYQLYITIPIVQNLLENREFVTMDILDFFFWTRVLTQCTPGLHELLIWGIRERSSLHAFCSWIPFSHAGVS